MLLKEAVNLSLDKIVDLILDKKLFEEEEFEAVLLYSLWMPERVKKLVKHASAPVLNRAQKHLRQVMMWSHAASKSMQVLNEELIKRLNKSKDKIC